MDATNSFTDILALYLAAGPRVDNPAFVAFLSVIPAWLGFVLVDKYPQGVPLLEGPIWRRPLKSRPTIASEDNTPSKTRDPDDHSQVESGSVRFATPYPEPSYMASPLEHPDTVLSVESSLSARASTPLSAGSLKMTGLVVYQPLEVHDHSAVPLLWGCALMICALVTLLLCSGIFMKRKFEEPRKAKKANLHLSNITFVETCPLIPTSISSGLSFSPITSVGTTPFAPALPPPITIPSTQTTGNQLQDRLEEIRELKKVIGLMDENSEKQKAHVVKLQQQNRGLRWAGDQKTKKLAAAETRAIAVHLPLTDQTPEPAHGKNHLEDVPQKDQKSEEELDGCAQPEVSEEGGKSGIEEEQKMNVNGKEDSDSDDSGQTPDLSLFFKIGKKKRRRRRARRPNGAQAEDAVPSEEPVGGNVTIESPSSAPSHELHRKEIQETALDEEASTPSATALIPSETPNHTPVENAQGSPEVSGKGKERMNSVSSDTMTSKTESHGDNGKGEGNEEEKEGGIPEEIEEKNEEGIEKRTEEGNEEDNEEGKREGRKVTADATASEKNREDSKEARGNDRKGHIEEDKLRDGNDALEQNGLHENSVVGGVKKKRRGMRTSAKRRIARRVAAEQASREAEEAPGASREDEQVEQVEVEAHDPPKTGLGGAP